MARLVLERTDRLTFDIGEEELATVAADGTGEAVIPGTLWGDVMPSWCPTAGGCLDAHRPGKAVRASHRHADEPLGRRCRQRVARCLVARRAEARVRSS
jgi:hypothetical protein